MPIAYHDRCMNHLLLLIFTYIKIEQTVFHVWKLRGHLSGTQSTAFPFLGSFVNLFLIVAIVTIVCSAALFLNLVHRKCSRSYAMCC